MRPLRTQLLWGTLLGITAILVAAGVIVQALVSRAVLAEFDDALAARVRSLSALVELDRDEVEFELGEMSLPEFEPSERAEYFQLWLADGSVHTRSASLQGEDLPRVVGEEGAAVFRDCPLPDGRPGRVVGITFQPRSEYGDSPMDSSSRATLVLARDTIGVHETLADVRLILGAVGVLAILLSAVVLSLVVRRGLRPISSLCEQIRGIGDNDLASRLSSGGAPIELTPIVDRLNELFARIEATFLRERRFTGDVAHELRTPLAGLRSKMEVALSRERDVESYRETLSGCLSIAQEMQRIVVNLLHLARADAGQLEVRRGPVVVAEVVSECLRQLAQAAASRGLRIECRVDHVGSIETDGDMLRLVLQNLLDNAVEYADRDTTIGIAALDRDGSLTLTITNTAKGLGPGDTAHVFDRFWRRDASFGGGAAHGGLGLALCKAVVEQLGGEITAETPAESTFRATLRIPH